MMKLIDFVNDCSKISPIAKTNILDIDGNICDNINKLFEVDDSSGLYVTHGQKKFFKEEGENNKRFYARVHKEIQQIIRKKLTLSSLENVVYDSFWKNYGSFSRSKEIHFFYLSHQESGIKEFVDKFEEDSDFLCKVFSAIVGLHIKRTLLKELDEHYEIEPVFYNSELYLSAEKYSQIIDAFYPRFYFSMQKELVVNLHRKVFRIETKKVMSGNTEETQLSFRTKENDFQVTGDINATEYSKKKFMRFKEGYRNSKNYSQNLVIQKIKEILNHAEIPFSERYFRADYVLHNFITVDKNFSYPLVLIDARIPEHLSDKKVKIYFEKEVKEIFDLQELAYAPVQSFESLDKSNNYLVLNSLVDEAKTSILVEGKRKNTIWDAFDHVRGKGIENADLDYYTELKIHRFEAQGEVVIQGIDLDNNIVENDKKTGLEKLSSKVLIKIQKIKSELWLKEKIFKERKIENIDLPDSKMTLIYIRAPGVIKKREEILASIVDVYISNKTLFIKGHSLAKNARTLEQKCPFMKNIKTFYNDSFYLVDEVEKICLSRYHSDRIPRIIGNQRIDNIEYALEDESLVNRVCNPIETVLPYYLAPKQKSQYEHIYLQPKGDDLLYFVSPCNSPNQTIAKENLIYNILTMDKEGKQINAMEQNITSIFLRSFTNDVLRLKEVSKSSLFEKIAKIYIEN
ncbi:hypothetical protein [Photorhabdus heterorhabditis]|uniref:hypothetical protein n=1 Tax=Photorhabdus heterorhabditis TaxID=880156 RepID=UPI001BD66793|nr:hypothetical protein [Photorhabdus heterorhabditis]MBS9442065.1 hypothetical protein [Photorhabdus heterorhabditis]